MTRLTAFRAGKALLLASLFGAALAFALPAEAQQGKRVAAESGPSGIPNGYYAQRGPRGGGAYPLTFSWIWGPAKMPPAPTDFGPHFDFPSGYSLNGVPDRSPYPD